LLPSAQITISTRERAGFRDNAIRIAATSSCRAAVKDGHVLDPLTAQRLLFDIFNLKDPHCPHGRPIWTKITKEELFRAVRRTE
ncbi:MAG: hypothetical protein ACFNOK_08620, partial [Aggregatibacter sp.]